MAGAPSQIDLFDPKPKLNELHGQVLPESMTKNVRFAFINKNSKLLGSSRTYKKYGQCGMEFSDLLPHLGSCATTSSWCARSTLSSSISPSRAAHDAMRAGNVWPSSMGSGSTTVSAANRRTFLDTWCSPAGLDPAAVLRSGNRGSSRALTPVFLFLLASRGSLSLNLANLTASRPNFSVPP